MKLAATPEAGVIFADARDLYASSLERLEAGDVRDAAEKAWAATLRATIALILSRTGEEAEKTPVVSRLLDQLASEDNRVKVLVGRYYSRQTRLHGDCFYSGIMDGLEEVRRRIRETDLYIRDAEGLVYAVA